MESPGRVLVSCRLGEGWDLRWVSKQMLHQSSPCRSLVLLDRTTHNTLEW